MSELQEAKKKIEELNNAINQDRLAHEKLVEQIKDAEKLIADTENKAEEASLIFKRQSANNDAMLANQDKAIAEKRGELNEMSIKISSLKDEIKKLQADKLEAENNLSVAKDRHAVTLKNHEAEIAEKKSIGKAQEEVNLALLDKKNQVMNAKLILETDITFLEDKKKKLEKANEELETSVTTKESKVEGLNREIETLGTKISLLKNEADLSEKDADDKRKETKKVLKDLKDAEKELSDAVTRVAQINAKDETLKQKEEFTADQYSRIGLPYKPFTP